VRALSFAATASFFTPTVIVFVSFAECMKVWHRRCQPEPEFDFLLTAAPDPWPVIVSDPVGSRKTENVEIARAARP
jgi:hypothetical protein